MPSMLVTDVGAELAAGVAVDVQPPAGEAWCLYEFGSEEAFVNSIPDLDYGIADGVLTLSLIVIDPTTEEQKGGRPKEIYITNANYLTITNRSGNAAFPSWTGERVNANNVITDMVTVPNAGAVDVQPPAGQTWRITEIGAELYNGGQNHPEFTVGITDGTLIASIILREGDDRAQVKALDWIIDNTIYLRLTSSTGAAVDNDCAYCGVLFDKPSIGSLQDVVGSANLDIQPPATQEWVITEFAAETWAGAAPAGAPNMTVSLYDGTNLSDVLEPSLPSMAWNRKFHVHIDNGTYLRIAEGSAANNEIGLLGYLKREYS